MPAHGEISQIVLVQSTNRKLRDQLFKGLPVQTVQDHVTSLRVLAYLIHRSSIDSAPAIDQRGPVRLDAALLAPVGEIRDQAGAPSNDRTDGVKNQCLQQQNVPHLNSWPLTGRATRLTSKQVAI